MSFISLSYFMLILFSRCKDTHFFINRLSFHSFFCIFVLGITRWTDFPWNWLTDLGWLNWIGLHCFVHIPNLVYTVTVLVYTLRHIRLFLFTAGLIWLSPCFSLLGDNPEWLLFWRCKMWYLDTISDAGHRRSWYSRAIAILSVSSKTYLSVSTSFHS